MSLGAIRGAHCRTARRLRIESLEQRTMLAQYAFLVNLYEDIGGVPGPRMLDDTVHAGESFFLEITAQDLRPHPRGLGGLGLRIEWDPQVLESIDTPFHPADPNSPLVTQSFPVWRGGTLDNAAGQIDSLVGMTDYPLGPGKLIGVEGPERFSLLHFRAEQPVKDSPILLSVRGGVGFVPMRRYTSRDLSFETQTITVLAPSEPAQGTSADATAAGEASTTRVGEDSGGLPAIPASSNAERMIDIANPGRSPFTIQEIQVSAPDVGADIPLTADPGDDLVVPPGQTQRLRLTYASSNAESGPWVEIRLVGLGEFGQFAAQYRVSRLGAQPVLLTLPSFLTDGLAAAPAMRREPVVPLASTPPMRGDTSPMVASTAAVDVVHASEPAVAETARTSTELDEVVAAVALGRPDTPGIWGVKRKDGTGSDILPTIAG